MASSQSREVVVPPVAPPISYTVVPVFNAESFDVTVELPALPEDTITFHLPIWAPGAYDVVTFGGYVSAFTARDSKGTPLQVEHPDASTWRIPNTWLGPVVLRYRIHDVETPRESVWFCTSDVDSNYVFANGAAVFGYVAGEKERPCRVGFTVRKGWELEVGLGNPTALKVGGGPGEAAHTVVSYNASDYDELIDMPFQMGRPGRNSGLRTATFKAGGKPHVVTLTAIGADPEINLKELADTTARIVKIVSDFFGEMPYDRYLFQHFIGSEALAKFRSAYGALEHRNSSSYLSPSFAGSESYAREMATEIAHEYFHAWSPKRIHVGTLGPFDYQSPSHTTSLWFAEGLTEYYCRVLLSRGGMIRRERFLGEFGQDIAGLYNRRQLHSMTEVSLAIASVSPNESTPALYSKGPVIGLLLDAAIRSQTDNARSLDDAMRYFNSEYGRTGRTFNDEDIIPIMERATGAKLADFYARYIAGREPLPIDEYLPKIGLKLTSEPVARLSMGAEMERVDTGFVILSIQPHGSADTMGLRVNDTIIGLDVNGSDLPVSILPPGFEGELATIGGTRSITILRDGAALKVPANFREGAVMTHRLIPDPGAAPAALAMRKAIAGF